MDKDSEDDEYEEEEIDDINEFVSSRSSKYPKRSQQPAETGEQKQISSIDSDNDSSDAEMSDYQIFSEAYGQMDDRYSLTPSVGCLEADFGSFKIPTKIDNFHMGIDKMEKNKIRADA